MSEFEDQINSLLNDPGQMDKIAALAKSLMGGEAGETKTGKTPAAEDGFDPALLGKLAGLLKKGGAQDGERTALLNAMKPYLSEKRRSKKEKALKLARIAKLAELAAGEFGGDGNV